LKKPLIINSGFLVILFLKIYYPKTIVKKRIPQGKGIRFFDIWQYKAFSFFTGSIPYVIFSNPYYFIKSFKLYALCIEG